MAIRFTKMHGIGNDFVVLDERDVAAPPLIAPERIRALADRRSGIGFDGLVRLRPPSTADADIRMMVHNADGTEAAACGNATRCVALLSGASRIAIGDAVVHALVRDDGTVTVDMGPPRLDAAALGLTAPVDDTLHLPLPGDPAGCSMGNPHATLFDDPDRDPPTLAPERDGHRLATDPLFAGGANIGFARVLAPDRIRLRVWERGAGLTLACGTGACAALVNAHRRGHAGRRAALELDGGTLEIEWRAHDDHVLMTGPAAISFTGTVTP